MLIQLNTGESLNSLWLSDCFQDKKDEKSVIYIMVNGTRYRESFDTSNEAEDRVEEVKSGG